MSDSYKCYCCKNFYPFLLDFYPSMGECRYNPPIADKTSDGKYSRAYPICDSSSDGCKSGWERCEPSRYYQQVKIEEFDLCEEKQ